MESHVVLTLKEYEDLKKEKQSPEFNSHAAFKEIIDHLYQLTKVIEELRYQLKEKVSI